MIGAGTNRNKRIDKMIFIFTFLIFALVALGLLFGCNRHKANSGGLIINDKETGIKDYYIMEDHIEFPVQKLLFALGAKYTKGLYNKPQSVYLELNGEKIVIDYGEKILAIDKQPSEQRQLLQDEENQLAQEDQSMHSLLPLNAEKKSYISWQAAELYVDDDVFMHIIQSIGIEIDIQRDDSNKTISINTKTQGNTPNVRTKSE